MSVVLETLGLGAVEERVYLSLLRTPTRTRADLSARLELDDEELAGAMAALMERGLVHDDERGPRVVPPELGLGALLVRHQSGLQRVQGAVARLAEEYRGREALHDSGALVEVVSGRTRVADRYLEIQTWAAKEVCALVTGPVLAVRSEDNHVAPRSMEAGILHRVVYDRRLVEAEENPVRLDRWRGLGEEIRVGDDLPMKLTLVDAKVAFLPTITERLEEPSAIIVRGSGLLDALLWMFEAVWRSSVPYLAEPVGQGLDEDERRLLSLMLMGGTDSSIAKRLGVSERTVQRRAGRLAEMVGARTRLQLIWQATRRGWL